MWMYNKYHLTVKDYKDVTEVHVFINHDPAKSDNSINCFVQDYAPAL